MSDTANIIVTGVLIASPLMVLLVGLAMWFLRRRAEKRRAEIAQLAQRFAATSPSTKLHLPRTVG